ncbi:sodium/solute symporter [Emticicia sp. BO119]|nr:sodium/solute symporter [Emticicia sp. BO119]
MLLSLHTSAQSEQNKSIAWSELAPLPGQNQMGLAGAIIGLHNDALMVAGGSNFSEGMPWKGGKKKYYSEIYVLLKNEKGVATWAKETFNLPANIAYSASVSTPVGVLAIGGENENGLSKKVFLLQWNHANKKVAIKLFPDLPVALTNASATIIGNMVYVAGGETLEKTLHTFYSLDISVNATSWKKLPDIPTAVSHTVAVTQSNGEYPCIYLLGGRAKTATGISSLYSTNYRFDSRKNQWTALKNIGDGKSDFPALSAGTGVAIGATYILLIGGDKGDIFSRIEKFNLSISQAKTEEEKQQLIKEKQILLESHKGFSHDICLYNTVTDVWTKVGEVPFNTPVTTTAVKWKDEIIIPSGEIRPGIRTSKVLRGVLVKKQYFSWIDYSVLATYLLLMIGIGLITSQHQGSTDDYFRGGQKIPGWAAGLSIYGTQLSAITFMSIPAKTYATNWNYFMLQMTIIMVIPIITTYFIPFFRKLEITSAYEYLEKRFSYLARALASLLYILMQVGRLAIVLLLPSLALTLVTGINVSFCILAMGIITIFYTMKGGIEAVVWTDVIQVVILLGGALLCLILIPLQLQTNISTLWGELQNHAKLDILNTKLSFSESTLWVVLIGGIAINVITYGADQTVVQKYLTTKDEQASKKSLKLGAWMALPSALIFFTIGSMLFLFYRAFPEKTNFSIESQDSIFPWYIVNQLPPGIVGLLIAAVFAAAMSTLSSSLNSVTTAIIIDFYKKYNPSENEKKYLSLARIITLIMGIIATSLAMFMVTQGISSLWDEFNTILGLFTGGLGGLFVLGIFTERATAKGTILGLICSGIVQYLINKFTSINFLLYAFTGLVCCVFFGYLFSLVFKEKQKDITGLTVFG